MLRESDIDVEIDIERVISWPRRKQSCLTEAQQQVQAGFSGSAASTRQFETESGVDAVDWSEVELDNLAA
jgi:hypothetical protein